MIYPYAGRDLFAEPESYAYAKCDDARFLEEWKKSRMAAKLALVRRANQPLEGERKTHTNAAADAITLSSLLEGQISSNGDRIPGENHATVLESFVAKFEVFGRLFAWYRNDGRRHPDSPTADLATYIQFAERLSEIAEASASLKHLSALLKLCDALTSQPAIRYRSEEAANLAALLDREASLVNGVAQSK